MNLPNHMPSLEEKSYAELLELRAELVAKGNGHATDLNDDDLSTLVQIFALLRRRQSGPPGTKKKASAKADPAAMDNLLGF